MRRKALLGNAAGFGRFDEVKRMVEAGSSLEERDVFSGTRGSVGNVWPPRLRSHVGNRRMDGT